uniref:DNA polymerase III beta sliding clamp N-terminal domain-containing protein n=1 Tax=Litorilinea aerophila TaxID=1204385 RepID=A0A540V8W9_9CHLR
MSISSKTTIPILTGIKIDVTDNGVLLTGSDADITIQTFIPAEENGDQIINIIETGSIVLQARMFNEIVRKLPTNDVEIEVDGGITEETVVPCAKAGATIFVAGSAIYNKKDRKAALQAIKMSGESAV